MKYFVKMFGKAFGPIDEQKVRQMYHDNKIDSSTEISRDKVEWVRVVDVFVELTISIPDENIAVHDEMPLGTPAIPSAQQANTTPQLEQPIWFYSTDGRSGFGPVTKMQIRELIQQGTLNRRSLVWGNGENSRYLELEPRLSDLLNINSPINLPHVPPIPQSMPNATMSANALTEQMVSIENNSIPLSSPYTQQNYKYSQYQQSSNTQDLSDDTIICRSTYILLALILGCFGIHNFYARRMELGLYELLAGLTCFTLIIVVFLASFLSISDSNSPYGNFLYLPCVIFMGEYIWIVYEAFTVTTDGNGREMI